MILSALLAASALSAPSPSVCNMTAIDLLSQEVFFFAVNPVANLDPKAVKEDCRKEENAISFANDFVDAGCLKGIVVGMFKLIFEGASNEHEGKCTDGHQKNKDYFKYVPCINKVGREIGDCMRGMSSVMEASSAQAPEKNRVAYTCCEIFRYYECVKKTIASACDADHVAYGDRVVAGIAGDFMDTICVSHRLNSPKCKALPRLKLAPAKSSTLVVPLLQNLERLG